MHLRTGWVDQRQGVAGVVRLGGGRRPPQSRSLVCKGWNIQSVGAPGARTPCSSAPHQASAASFVNSFRRCQRDLRVSQAGGYQLT